MFEKNGWQSRKLHEQFGEYCYWPAEKKKQNRFSIKIVLGRKFNKKKNCKIIGGFFDVHPPETFRDGVLRFRH